jgi:hypothetical protein
LFRSSIPEAPMWNSISGAQPYRNQPKLKMAG